MLDFAYADESQQWFEYIVAQNLEKARSRAFTLVGQGLVLSRFGAAPLIA
jgi:hypothetical protein